MNISTKREGPDADMRAYLGVCLYSCDKQFRSLREIIQFFSSTANTRSYFPSNNSLLDLRSDVHRSVRARLGGEVDRRAKGGRGT